VAENIRTGMLTSPKEIVPDQIDRAAIGIVLPGGAAPKTEGKTDEKTERRFGSAAPAKGAGCLLHPAGGR
jgi:hypothetical protein